MKSTWCYNLKSVTVLQYLETVFKQQRKDVHLKLCFCHNYIQGILSIIILISIIISIIISVIIFGVLSSLLIHHLKQQ